MNSTRPRKKTAITSNVVIAEQAGKSVQKYLRSHPRVRKLIISLKNGKFAVKSHREPRIAPPGFFDSIYTKQHAAEDNQLAKVSVIDSADFDV